jgi:hypothetical protein
MEFEFARNRKKRINILKEKREKIPKVNLIILSYINHTFLILEPKPSDMLIVP